VNITYLNFVKKLFRILVKNLTIPNTTVSVTPQGLKALNSYIEEMEGIIKTLKQA